MFASIARLGQRRSLRTGQGMEDQKLNEQHRTNGGNGVGDQDQIDKHLTTSIFAAALRDLFNCKSRTRSAAATHHG